MREAMPWHDEVRRSGVTLVITAYGAAVPGTVEHHLPHAGRAGAPACLCAPTLAERSAVQSGEQVDGGNAV